MTDQAEAEHPEGIPPERPTLQGRAQRGFGWLSLFVGIVLLVLAVSLTARGQVFDVTTIVRLVPGVASFAALAIAWYGVARRRPWAVAAIVPSLWIVISGGLAATVVALTRSTLQIPFDVVIGFWILRAPPEAPAAVGARAASTGTRLASIGLVALFAFGAFGSYGTNAVLANGGLFAAGPSDLDLAVSVQCEAPGPPERIVVTVTPGWHRSEPFASGSDTLVISWLDEADGGVSGYELAATQGVPAGFLEANRVSALGTESIVISADVATSQRSAQDVRIVLERHIPDAPPTGTVQLAVRYVHRPSDPYDPASTGAWEIRRQDACHW